MKTNLTTLTAAFALATALPGAAHGIQSHGRAAHHPRSLGQHHRRLRLRDVDDGKKSLVVALGVYPHEEPGIGPNIYNFDDNVLYEIHVATGRDLAAGKPTISYQFEFKTTFKNQNTILVSYLGVYQLTIADARAEPRSDVHGHQGQLGTPRPYSARESFRRTIRVTLRPFIIRVTTATTRPGMAFRRLSSSTDTPNRPLRH